MSLLEFSQTYKPFQYPWAVELSKKHEEVHWIEDEAELSEDVQDWKTKLSVNEKDFITQVLGYSHRVMYRLVRTITNC